MSLDNVVQVFIPSSKMGEFLHKIDSIQSAAKKLELPAWIVEVSEPEWRPVSVYGIDLYGKSVCSKMLMEGCPVSITGEPPVLGGWKFLAKVEHNKDGNLIKGMGGDDLPIEWHECAPNCDHCGTNRQRKTTFMLENVENGEMKQIGSSCIADFTGDMARDPMKIASMYDHLMLIEKEFDYDPEWDMSGGLAHFGISPEKLMAATLKIVQEDGGYLSKEKAEKINCLNTGERLRSAFWGKGQEVHPDEAQISQAPEIVGWLKGQNTVSSLWLRNIAVLCNREAVTFKDAGLLASGYVAWNQELSRSLRKENGSGEWIGEKGAKVTIQATLDQKTGFDTAFGFKHILTFRDDAGNGLVWKTQSPPYGLVLGSTYNLQATVKDHGEYRDEKQTEIIRAKFSELELFVFGSVAGYKKMAALAIPDRVDERGITPLVQALWGDHVAHAKILLDAGADANSVNQGEVALLGYAQSIEMAQVLLNAGARVLDVKDQHLQEMLPEIRDFLLASVPNCNLVMSNSNSVSAGMFHGTVLSISDTILSQAVGRGEVVEHDISNLSGNFDVADMVEIVYKDGAGKVTILDIGKEITR